MPRLMAVSGPGRHRRFEFTSDRVGALPGVESADVSPIYRQVKQASTLVAGNRLEERPKVRRR